MRLTFYGVRGSTPSHCETNRRYGGNTACVVLDEPGEEPILFDLGTGLRLYGSTCRMDGTFAATALITHLHWDHVQGLPFFPPVHVPGGRLDVYGPAQEAGSVAAAFDGLMRPPYFPVRRAELGGDVRFHDAPAEPFAVGSLKITAGVVPHVGPTAGWRVDGAAGSVAYISDHQAPAALDTVAASVLELVDGVDVLIHDAQYTPAEFAAKSDWGHCTTEYALLVARTARARRLVLFHHDPGHSDDVVDRLCAELQATADGTGVDVLAAYEGLVLDL